jgi:hypothetical protein
MHKHNPQKYMKIQNQQINEMQYYYFVVEQT